MILRIKEIRENHKKGVITLEDALKGYEEIADSTSEIIEKKNRLMYQGILELEVDVKNGHVTNMIDGVRNLASMVRSIQRDENCILWSLQNKKGKE